MALVNDAKGAKIKNPTVLILYANLRQVADTIFALDDDGRK